MKRRVGLVIPQLDILTEPLLARILGMKLAFHTSRLRRRGAIDRRSLKAMNESLEPAVELLPSEALDLIVYHCTAGSLAFGAGLLVEQIEAMTGVPAIATLNSINEALHRLKVRNLTLVTPYDAPIVREEVNYFASSGFQISAKGGRPVPDSLEMQGISQEEIVSWVRAAVSPDSEGVVISCTGLQSFDAIEDLETVLGIPVVTSTSAMIRSMLDALHIPDSLSCGGMLLSGGMHREYA